MTKIFYLKHHTFHIKAIFAALKDIFEKGEYAKLIPVAEKAIETARVYRFYQDYLERERLLDFGDLIYRTVRLIQEN